MTRVPVREGDRSDRGLQAELTQEGLQAPPGVLLAPGPPAPVLLRVLEQGLAEVAEGAAPLQGAEKCFPGGRIAHLVTTQ